MKKSNSTKRSLVASVLVLCLCFTMLVGTTFAWFTDSVSSSGNVIKSGKLDVEMVWADGSEDPETANWQESTATIFSSNTVWEPGFTTARHFKVSNEGTLALKYEMRIVTTDVTLGKLAEVIDVYFFDTAVPLTRDALTSDNYLGTMAEVGGKLDKTVNGVLRNEGDADVFTLVFKMQESAGNDYMDLTVDSSFSVVVLATQLNSESDSFGNDYDEGIIPGEDGVYEILEDGTELVYTDDGEVTLYDTANVTSDTYYVPDGVTTLGNYCFAYNNTIKNVVVSDSVENLGRAFDSSKVENVVLPEGLEQIDSRAFRSTSALQSVTIPSTVKVIEDNAFQKSAIKTITIPATVETIGETAFGSSLVEEVIFEGNTSIQGYAFRGATKLRTVVMYGDDIQFITSTLNGRNSMWFCNGESNNPNTSDIDFHVVSETMKERVLTAMGAERNNTDVYVDINTVSTDADLGDMVANSDDENTYLVLGEGTYSSNIDLTVDALGQAQTDTVVFKAEPGKEVVFNGTVTLGYRDQGTAAAKYEADVVFDGVTFDVSAGGDAISVQDVKSVTLRNCTIIGNGENGITSARGNNTGNSIIENCTFINASIQVLGNFGTGLVIDGCTFNNSRINVQAGNGVTVQNCVFNNTIDTVNVDDSFYAIRSNSTPITVKNCELNIDSKLTEAATAQTKWYLLANRGTTNWTVENVKVNLTEAALLQTELVVTACTSTGVINATKLTVNGVEQ